MQTTVIIVCYNWWEYLEESIKSIQQQTVPVEVLVMTDGSSDKVIEICEKLAIKFINSTDAKNNTDRLNKAVESITTPYYVILGVDDFLENNYIQLTEEVLRDNSIDVVHCDIDRFGDEQGRWNSVGLVEGIKDGNTMFISSLVRKSLWEKLGGYDIDIPYSLLEDWDFWVRAYYAKAVAWHIQEPLFKYRSHSRQMTRTTVPAYAGEVMNYLRNKWASY